MLYICISVDVRFNGINDSIIGHATFDDVIAVPRPFARPAVDNEVEPFLVVSIKALDAAVCGANHFICVVGWALGLGRVDLVRAGGYLRAMISVSVRVTSPCL